MDVGRNKRSAVQAIALHGVGLHGVGLHGVGLPELRCACSGLHLSSDKLENALGHV
jgi:hypothetical protein